MLHTAFNSLFRNHYSLAVTVILILSAAIRIFHYFYNRSLWLDELYLSSSLSHMSLEEILKGPLDYGQNAPVGFLVFVKTAVTLFGFNEMALRIVPLLTGLVSIFYFNRLSSRLLDKTGKIIAIIICGFAPAIIYHSVEVKQYSTELLASILAIYSLTSYKDKCGIKSRVLWGLLGAIFVCFSFSVIFILAGIMLGLGLTYIKEKKLILLRNFSITVVLWLGSFIVNYLFFTYKQSVDWVVYFFKTYDNFMPLFPTSSEELMWFPKNLGMLMDYPLGLNWNFNYNTVGKINILLSAVLSLLLIYGMFKAHKSNKQILYVFVCVLLLTCAASGLNLYPLVERFWLFLTPILIYFIAKGFQHWKLKNRYLKILVLTIVVGSPVLSSVYYLVKPQLFYKHKKSYQKESFRHLITHFKPNDGVYIYWNNRQSYAVYNHIFKFNFDVTVGDDFRKYSRNIDEYNLKLCKDINRLSKKSRIWVIYNTKYLTDIGDYADDPKWYYSRENSPTENLYFQFLKIGHPLKVVKFSDVTIALFELKR